MTISILPLTANDKNDWRNLWHNYLAFYNTDVSDEVYETTFNRLVDQNNLQQHALIARQQDEAIGLVHYIYHAHNWRVEDVCYLQDLYVDSNVRNQGVGRSLIESVYAAADKNDVSNVYWLTQESNEAARLLYDNIAELTPFVKYQRS